MSNICIDTLAENLDTIPCSAPPKTSFIEIKDINEAYDYATLQEIDGHEDWTGLRETQASETMGASYKIAGGQALYDVKYDNYCKRLFSYPEVFIEADVCDEISTDFLNISRSNAIPSKATDFFDMLIGFYNAGYWPCGWKGEYPNGELLVFKFGK